MKRRTNPTRLKQRAKHKAGDDGTDPSAASGAPAAKKPRMQMPDEYLPPNNVLFVQNLPEGTTQDDLRDVFEQHAGLLEIRTIPAKRDIAFIEFADEGTATVAKDALHNFKIDGETKMKVSECGRRGWIRADILRAGHVREEVEGYRCIVLRIQVRGGIGAGARAPAPVAIVEDQRRCWSLVVEAHRRGQWEPRSLRFSQLPLHRPTMAYPLMVQSSNSNTPH